MPRAVPSSTQNLAQKPVTVHSAHEDHGILQQLGGRRFVDETVGEFYQAIGKYLAPQDTEDHGKQNSRQAQFLNHALSAQPEPIHSARASFLARGLNPTLFEALLEFLEARLLELGFSLCFAQQLVTSASDLYDNCEEPLSIAC